MMLNRFIPSHFTLYHGGTVSSFFLKSLSGRKRELYNAHFSKSNPLTDIET